MNIQEQSSNKKIGEHNDPRKKYGIREFTMKVQGYI